MVNMDDNFVCELARRAQFSQIAYLSSDSGLGMLYPAIPIRGFKTTLGET
jgi:hypothetical protein